MTAAVVEPPAPPEPARPRVRRWKLDRHRVTRPGIYTGMPDETYHSDPVPAAWGGSLSSTGARRILQCPARFAHDRAHPPPSKKTFDLGKAAHLLVLGAGPPLAVGTWDAWTTSEAKAFRASAVAAGQVPLKPAEYQQVYDMAAALRRHRLARALLSRGRPEVSLFWTDDPTGAWCRARLDWLPRPRDGRRLIVTDYKTSTSADPDDFRRSAASYGYPTQAAFYLAGVRALGLNPDPAFMFVVQETTPPYLVSVVELDAEAADAGAARARRAIDLFARCTRDRAWPGYTDDEPALLSLPRWYVNDPEGDLPW